MHLNCILSAILLAHARDLALSSLVTYSTSCIEIKQITQSFKSFKILLKITTSLPPSSKAEEFQL